MPELPEVETVKEGLRRSWVGKVITKVELRRPNLRFAFPEDFQLAIEGNEVVDVRRRAKYILVDLSNGLSWLIHLGMTGRWSLDVNEQEEKHDHVKIVFSDGVSAVYNDVRRFGIMDIVRGSSHKLLDHLGPEPLEEWDGKKLMNSLEGKKSAIKIAILDQKTVVGVGNIYASEALYRAKISPHRPANRLSEPECERLSKCIRSVLLEAIKAGGSTLRDFRSLEGNLGYFPHYFKVYGKGSMPCECGDSIIQEKQAGRSTFWCKTCQA